MTWGQMVKTVEELVDEYSNLDVPDETNEPDAGKSLECRLRNAAQTESGESKMLVIEIITGCCTRKTMMTSRR